MRLYSFLKQKVANPISIASLLQNKPSSSSIEVKGWVKSKMKMKKTCFLKLDDGTTLERLQIVVPANLLPKTLAYHSCVSVKGKLVESVGKTQNIEVLADDIQVLSDGAPETFLYQEKSVYLAEDLRQVPEFRARTREFASTLRVRSQAKMNIIKYFHNEEFMMVDTPIITSNDCEGGGDIFQVKAHGSLRPHQDSVCVEDGVFGHPVNLTVSGQLHLEAIASALPKVFTFNPAFRTEATSRFHLNEFWMVESEEMCPCEPVEAMDQLLHRAETFLKHSCSQALENSLADLKYQWELNKKPNMEGILTALTSSEPFMRLPFKEAVQILDQHQIKHPKNGLNRQAELFLTQHFGNKALFVTDWPAISKPFYMLRTEANPDVALGFDLLVPYVGEIIGGSLREYKWKSLQARMNQLGILPQLNWYLKTKGWGSTSTCGFGMGFERYLQFILGIDNIRDTIAFPRSKLKCLC